MNSAPSPYDYIIVGAGSAGCVVAHRLSADPATRVLLLEAGGPDDKPEIHTPAVFWKTWKTECDWNRETEPQPALNNRKIYWPRGKVLGGSSSINAMVYVRGQREDYDQWAALGNEGWSYQDVLPYFKKSEHNERGASEYHGIGGPLNVADRPWTSPVSYAMIEAAVEAGVPRNPDSNGAKQEGVGLNQVTQKHGRRHSTAAAFLKPVLQRPNLTVLTHAHTTRVLFDKTRAVGVEYQRNGERQQNRAAREVILCSGADNSPQLLLLSGIGPAEHLRQWNIPVVADLPGVGQNLQDHLFLATAYRCTQPVTAADAESLGNRLRYALFKNGPLTTNGGESGGFVKLRPGVAAPDLQLAFIPNWFLDHGNIQPGGHGYTAGAVLLHPKSRGHLRLRSADPFDSPLIQPNFCAEKSDLEFLVEALKFSRAVGSAKALDPFRGEEVAPGPAVKSDEDIRAYIRRSIHTLYHPVGTCKMGHDSHAVVDSQLKVRGVDGLRVVDASIMPAIASGNTNAPTIMIGEKGADLILEQPGG